MAVSLHTTLSNAFLEWKILNLVRISGMFFQRAQFIISRHWFGWWFGAVRQQTITDNKEHSSLPHSRVTWRQWDKGSISDSENVFAEYRFNWIPVRFIWAEWQIYLLIQTMVWVISYIGVLCGSTAKFANLSEWNYPWFKWHRLIFT